MKIGIASDHRGFETKEKMTKYLIEKGYDVIDYGTYSKDRTDYTKYGFILGENVSNKTVEYGIAICGSAVGISVACNKVKGVRCGIGYNDDVARLIRQHNDCNMVSFGASFMSIEDILRRVDIFLNTDFEGGRHCLRVNTFVDYENNN